MAIRTIILLRRDRANLAEMDALAALYPNDDLSFIRTDPVDHLDHDRLCLELSPDLVFLPSEAPIPFTAMKRGVVHVVSLPSGQIKRLVRLDPVLEDI